MRRKFTPNLEIRVKSTSNVRFTYFRVGEYLYRFPDERYRLAIDLKDFALLPLEELCGNEWMLIEEDHKKRPLWLLQNDNSWVHKDDPSRCRADDPRWICQKGRSQYVRFLMNLYARAEDIWENAKWPAGQNARTHGIILSYFLREGELIIQDFFLNRLRLDFADGKIGMRYEEDYYPTPKDPEKAEVVRKRMVNATLFYTLLPYVQRPGTRDEALEMYCVARDAAALVDFIRTRAREVFGQLGAEIR
jgi:hypothetical protein